LLIFTKGWNCELKKNRKSYSNTTRFAVLHNQTKKANKCLLGALVGRGVVYGSLVESLSFCDETWIVDI
jgi:hypothetical protein